MDGDRGVLLFEVGRHCRHLESLDLNFVVWHASVFGSTATPTDDQYMEQLASKLPGLKSVCVRTNRYITLKTLISFLKHCPLLESVKFVNCPQVRISETAFNASQVPSSSTLKSFCHLVKRPEWRSLQSNMSDKVLLAKFARLFPNLTELRLAVDTRTTATATLPRVVAAATSCCREEMVMLVS